MIWIIKKIKKISILKITTKKTALLVAMLLLFCSFTQAQQVLVNVKIDTNIMLIGDQTNVTFEATFPESAMLSLPVFSDTIIDKLEILNISDIDTVKENGNIKIKQTYLVTNFDSGWYVIPPLNFTIGFPNMNRVDTIQSIPVYFGVMTMPIDTANANAITDIKALKNAPITFQEVLPFAGLGFGVLILAFLIYLLYLKLTHKEPLFIKHEKPKVPAHIIAFSELDKLKEDKLWQKGQVKEYYSRLTDIVRIYIEERYGILAMESTTDEIIDGFRISGTLDKELKDGLFDTLVRADFVKFAKANPLADENDESLKFAYKFITKTKPVEVLREEDEAKKTSEQKVSDVKQVDN